MKKRMKSGIVTNDFLVAVSIVRTIAAPFGDSK